MLRMTATALAGMTIAGAAQAGDWRHVASSSSGSLAVDASSVRQIGSVRRFWTVSASNEREAGHDYAIGLQEIDCADDTVRVLQANWFTLEGDSVSSEGASTTQYIIPGTGNEASRGAVCNGIWKIATGFDTAKDFAQAVRDQP